MSVLDNDDVVPETLDYSGSRSKVDTSSDRMITNTNYLKGMSEVFGKIGDFKAQLPSYYSRGIDEVKKYSKDDFIMLSDLDYEIKEIAETIEALTKSKFFKENHNAYLYDKSGIIGNQVYKVLEELKKLSYTVQDSWWQVVGDNDVMDLPVSEDVK